MKIARYYAEQKNADGAHYPGVPQRDLTEEEFKALPEWIRNSIDGAPPESRMYYKSARSAKPADSEAEAVEEVIEVVVAEPDNPEGVEE